MGNEDLPNIYYMNAHVAYKKSKRMYNIQTWIVSRYNTPAEIMANDSKTMDRLKSDVYGKTYKGTRHVIIRDILSTKTVGKVNRNAL